MDQAFVDRLAEGMANICAEYDCTMVWTVAQNDSWILALHNSDDEEVESALVSDAGLDPNGIQLLKMIVSDTNPWTVFVSAIPKAVFSLLYA